MALNSLQYIHSQGDGRLARDSTPEHLIDVVEELENHQNVVIHIHGGLVTQASALRDGERLAAEYSEAGAYPIFMIWESGLLETTKNNVAEILREQIFESLASTIVRWVVGKLETDTSDIRAAANAGLQLPTDVDHSIEMGKRRPDTDDDSEPYAYVEMPRDTEVRAVTGEERAALIAQLTSDLTFQRRVRAIVQPLETTDVEIVRAGEAPVQSVTTAMDPNVVADMLKAYRDSSEGTRGVVAAVVLAKKAAAIFARCISRFLNHRDHGAYVTVVEEVLRELYLAKIGSIPWESMKRDTADTFVHAVDEARAGDLLLRAIGELWKRDIHPRISLVGHSTGAIFITNMIAAAYIAQSDLSHPLGQIPDGKPRFRFGDVIFLAPACSFESFAETITTHRKLFDEFRLFAMTDEKESTDRLVPGLYPRSLLYFVSGVVDAGPSGKGEFDLPLVGMERFYGRGDHDPYRELAGVPAVRDFVLGTPRRVAWSVTATDAAPGLQCDAISHGGFDDSTDGKPRLAIDSICNLLEKGWKG